MKPNPTLSRSIVDKYKEVNYNEKYINTPGGPVKIRLKGKIACPLLNCKITPITCAKLMDTEGWPRHVEPTVCESYMNCYIAKSIQKNMQRKVHNNGQRSKV